MPAPAAETVTITREQAQTYQNAIDLLQKVNANPAARKEMERAFKVINPALETEEEVAARLAAPFVDKLTATQAELADVKKRLADEDAARAAAADQAKVATAMSWLESQDYTDEGKAAIKKLMTDESIPNVQAAAALFEKRNPPPVNIPGANYQADSWDLRGAPDDKNSEALFKDESAWADREAAMALNEIRTTQARAAQAA